MNRSKEANKVSKGALRCLGRILDSMRDWLIKRKTALNESGGGSSPGDSKGSFQIKLDAKLRKTDRTSDVTASAPGDTPDISANDRKMLDLACNMVEIDKKT